MKHRCYHAWVGCMTCGGKYEVVLDKKRWCVSELQQELLKQNYDLVKREGVKRT
jgi:hypothetical protein